MLGLNVRSVAMAVLLLGAGLEAATVPQSELPLGIYCPSVAAGAMAQIRIVLAHPHQIAGGSIVLDFDPDVFGPVAAVDVFSATGDQIGVANISDRHVDARFSSPSGGMGRLPGIPVMTIEVPVLASAATGTLGWVTFAAGGTPWKDVQGYQYQPVTPIGQLKVGGAVSIESVTPGGGLLPAGSRIRIAGQGFVPQSTVQIDGVVLASTVFIGPQAMDVTLGAPADLTAKRVVLQNPDGTQANFYSALRGDVSAISPGFLIQPIFPLRTYPGASIGNFGTWFALQNQNPAAVDVTFVYNTSSEYGTYTSSRTFSLPAGGIYEEGPAAVPRGSYAYISVFPSAPIRMMLLGQPGVYDGDSLVADESPLLVEPNVPRLYPVWEAGLPSCSSDPFHGLVPQPACVGWQTGSSPPTPQVLSVTALGPPTSFTAAVTTADGAKWLTVSPAQGSTCLSGDTTCSSSEIRLKFDPLSLKPGEYNATLTVTPADTLYPAVTIPLVFRVAAAFISVQEAGFMNFATDRAGTPPPTQYLQVSSSGPAVPFSVSLSLSQKIWGNWISVTPMQGTTPATLTVTANPAAFPKGQYAQLGYITIAGPANSVTSTVQLILNERLPPPAMYTSAGDTPLVFWAKAGSTKPGTQFITISPYIPNSVAVVTDKGGTWLSAPVGENVNSIGLTVTVDPTGLDVGTYHGNIMAADTAHSDYAPAQVAVTLVIWDDPPPITVVPASLVFSVRSGTSIGNYDPTAPTLTVTSGGTPVDSSIEIATVDGNDWLTRILPIFYEPVAGVSLDVDARNLPPGTYEATVKISAPVGSPNAVSVPVTLHVTPALPVLPQAGPPLGVSIANGASLRVGAVAPGEMLNIFGLNIGPSPPAWLRITAEGKVNTLLGGARVLFNNVPAPLVYASATQVNTIVPFEVAGETSVDVQVDMVGTAVTMAGVPVAQSAPGVFSVDGTGVGQANAFNEDNSPNGSLNPAGHGSMIRFLATGAGQTIPASFTGEITRDVKRPVLPVSVQIGGVQTTVADVRSAEGQPAGTFEVQVRVPQSVAPGPEVSLVVMVGSATSGNGVTIAVK